MSEKHAEGNFEQAAYRSSAEGTDSLETILSFDGELYESKFEILLDSWGRTCQLAHHVNNVGGTQSRTKRNTCGCSDIWITAPPVNVSVDERSSSGTTSFGLFFLAFGLDDSITQRTNKVNWLGKWQISVLCWIFNKSQVVEKWHWWELYQVYKYEMRIFF